MDIILAFVISFILLIFTVLKNYFVGYTLTIILIIFGYVAIRRGFKFKDIVKMSYKGGKKSFVVLKIFILIGAITSTWMASGTVPAIVYYGLKFLNPNLFILSAFLITSVVSVLIGTSFGTVSTVGIALIVMAKAGGVNPSITAGAILAGAFLGDRCSPMSSSANLVAHLTETELYVNIKNMIKTSAIPLILAIIIYTVLSFKFPLSSGENSLNLELIKSFDVSLITLLPAVIIFVFAIFKVEVKKLILISSIAASIIAIIVQHNTLINVIKYIFFGYEMNGNSPLKTIIKGGGILSMLKISLVVFVSSAFTGIFEDTNMLKTIEDLVSKSKSRTEIFVATIITSIATSAFGCSQALAVILTHLLVKKTYEDNNISNEEFAIDIENTAIVIAPLVPWNIAVLVPLTALGATASAIPYAFYLYFLPIINLAYLYIKIKRKSIMAS